jgi:molybdopterin molybdotransferase
VRSRLGYENGRLLALPSGVDKSNIVMSLAGADALMVLPGGTRGYLKGDVVHVLLLEDDQGSSQPW